MHWKRRFVEKTKENSAYCSLFVIHSSETIAKFKNNDGHCTIVISAKESDVKIEKLVGLCLSFPRRRESSFANSLKLRMDPRLRGDDKKGQNETF